MAERAKTLTTLSVENLKPDPAKRLEIPDGGCRGLYLIVQPKPSGAKSWAVRYRYQESPRKLTLGPLLFTTDMPTEPPGEPQIGTPLTLAQARELAVRELRKIRQGVDPAAQKQASKRAQIAGRRRTLFEETVDDFVRLHCERHNKVRTAAETSRLLASRVTPIWKGRRIGEIGPEDVIALLDDIVAGDEKKGVKPAPIAANRVRAALLTLFKWAKGRRLITASPAEGVPVPTKERGRDRDRTPDDAELRLLWLAASEMGAPFGNLYKLLVLTGVRLREASDASLTEFDLKTRVWTIPGERMKAGRPHEVALSDQAVQIIEAQLQDLKDRGLKNEAKLLFTTTGEGPISGFSKAKSTLDKHMLKIAKAEAQKAGGDPDAVQLQAFVVHDIRRTVVSGLVGLGVREAVADQVLAHKGGARTGVAGTYNRFSYLEESRKALRRWAKHVERVTSADAPAGNVLPFDQQRAAR